MISIIYDHPPISLPGHHDSFALTNRKRTVEECGLEAGESEEGLGHEENDFR